MAVSVRINGVSYENVPEVQIPLANGEGSASFYPTDGDDAAASHILAGKKAHSVSGAVTGSMTNNGAVSEDIDAVADVVTIPEGYHSGEGSVQIASAEQAKIVAGNIKSGVTILGVTGSSSVVDTDGATATAARILSGYTAYAGGQLVTGTMTAATVSQDSTTKVLSIA